MFVAWSETIEYHDNRYVGMITNLQICLSVPEVLCGRYEGKFHYDGRTSLISCAEQQRRADSAQALLHMLK